MSELEPDNLVALAHRLAARLAELEARIRALESRLELGCDALARAEAALACVIATGPEGDLLEDWDESAWRLLARQRDG